MAVFLHDSVLDAALDDIATVDTVVLCDGQPADYTAATTDHPTGDALGEVTVTGVDFTKANGDTSGRKTTMTQQTGVTVDVTGTCDHIAGVDVGTTTLKFVTTCTSQAVTAGNTATINAFKIEFADAT